MWLILSLFYNTASLVLNILNVRTKRSIGIQRNGYQISPGVIADKDKLLFSIDRNITRMIAFRWNAVEKLELAGRRIKSVCAYRALTPSPFADSIDIFPVSTDREIRCVICKRYT
jgi:hypothetical protein